MNSGRLKPTAACAAVLVACAALLGGATDAAARSGRGSANAVRLRYPSDELNENGLRSVLQPFRQPDDVSRALGAPRPDLVLCDVEPALLQPFRKARIGTRRPHGKDAAVA